MKRFWHKLTIDWPCALGDFLWMLLVTLPVRGLDKLTRRRALHVVGLILLLLMFQYVVMFDLMFLFGMDLGLLMEVSAVVFILTARDRMRAAVAFLSQLLKSTATRPVTVCRRFISRARRIRVRRTLSPPDEDEDGLAIAFA